MVRRRTFADCIRYCLCKTTGQFQGWTLCRSSPRNAIPLSLVFWLDLGNSNSMGGRNAKDILDRHPPDRQDARRTRGQRAGYTMKLWRPRFSLKTLLILVTFVCVYFAAWEVTKRQGVKAHSELPAKGGG